jgi:hypothetical protein
MRCFKSRRCVECGETYTPTGPLDRWCSLLCRLLRSCDRFGGADACWPWRLSVDHNGYGYISKPPSPGRSRLAHRLLFEETQGVRLDRKISVLHSCDNPVCVNPRHLSKGTHLDNVRQMVARGRQNFANMAKGTAHHRATISDKTVLAIFNSPLSLDKVAGRFGVTRTIVHNIRYGRSWTHITGLARRPTARGRNMTRGLGVYCGMLGFGA